MLLGCVREYSADIYSCLDRRRRQRRCGCGCRSVVQSSILLSDWYSSISTIRIRSQSMKQLNALSGTNKLETCNRLIGEKVNTQSLNK
jgi:hypothetical protein